MQDCTVCGSKMQVSKLHCPGCRIHLEGHFQFPRLARLSKEDVKLAEDFILTGGNLKLLAEHAKVSYPTLRKRLDTLIANLGTLVEQDQKRISAILDRMEKGAISAEEGTRLIRETQGEL